MDISRRSTRVIIEEAAIALLARDGLEGFTAANLAREAGVSKANLYHHFDGLDAIMVAAFERLMLGMTAMEPSAETGLRDWLIGLGEEAFMAADTRAGVFRAYLAFCSRAMVDPVLRARVAGSIMAGTCTFSLIMEARGLHSDKADITARLAMASLDGLLMYLQVMPDQRGSLHAAWQAQVDLLAPPVPSAFDGDTS